MTKIRKGDERYPSVSEPKRQKFLKKNSVAYLRMENTRTRETRKKIKNTNPLGTWWHIRSCLEH